MPAGVMLRVIAALLIFWEPLRFAAEALAVFPTIAYRGAVAAIELVIHGGVAALAAAAGLALWNGTPDGRQLSSFALLAVVLRTLQSLYWSALPNNTPPGDEWFVAGVTLGAALIAAIVIRIRRRP
ncbi:MAG TPA: hypothetical protein VJ813_11655 [Vicinamibacterales bacterium]|nr:hypothetical protein [Vicinamibacterales bacterium]